VEGGFAAGSPRLQKDVAMSRFLNQVMAAMRRVTSRDRLEDKDIALILPMLEIVAVELNRHDPIRFVQIGRDFIIDTTLFSGLLGFGYVRMLLQSPDVHISCGRLNPAAVSTSQQRMIDYQDVRRLLGRADDLRDFIGVAQSSGTISPQNELEAIEELEFIEKYLDETTRMGRVKSFVSESDKVRQSVNRAINLALEKIENNAETRHIGEHLRRNIKLGYRCAYLGNWKWKF